MEALTASLIAIVLLILVSVLISFLVEKFNTKRCFLSNMVALLLLGIIISQISAMQFLKLDGAALAAFSTVALVIVAFHFSFLLKFSDLYFHSCCWDSASWLRCGRFTAGHPSDMRRPLRRSLCSTLVFS